MLVLQSLITGLLRGEKYGRVITCQLVIWIFVVHRIFGNATY